MSPIPPNKEVDKSNDEKCINSSHLPNQTGNLNDNDDSEFEVIDENNSDTYQPIPQDSQNNQEGNNSNNQVEDDEDDSDESDDDESVDIDPDLDFELLASSRVSHKPVQNSNKISYNNSHLFEQDVFERKNVLECEDIHLDDSKTKTINSLMSNFKLPDSSIPEWAKLVPENVWKKNLLDSLNAKKTDLFDLKSEQEQE